MRLWHSCVPFAWSFHHLVHPNEVKNKRGIKTNTSNDKVQHHLGPPLPSPPSSPLISLALFTFCHFSLLVGYGQVSLSSCVPVQSVVFRCWVTMHCIYAREQNSNGPGPEYKLQRKQPLLHAYSIAISSSLCMRCVMCVCVMSALNQSIPPSHNQLDSIMGLIPKFPFLLFSPILRSPLFSLGLCLHLLHQ